jgi:hypothetical protein
MRLVHPHRHTKRDDSYGPFTAYPRSVQLSSMGGLDEPASRHEPQILIERSAPKDPYAAWLEQREAESEREARPPIRWVQRPPADARRAGAAAAR